MTSPFPEASSVKLPLATADLPSTGGAIGPDPDDFQVDEVPLYVASGSGEHLYVRIEKRDLTTRDAVHRIALASGIRERDIGTAGMKDKHAVTRQWISLPARDARPVEGWALGDGLAVLEVSRHGNKLRTGHLRGNRFTIRLAGVLPDAEVRARAILDAVEASGLANYFGTQRFGRDGDNVASALAWLDAEIAGHRAPPFQRKLYPSVLQAEVFNRYAISRIAEGLSLPLSGEVVRLQGTGSHFVVDDPGGELPRWKARDILPTGPMIGPKMRSATGAAHALEERAAETLRLDADRRAGLGRFADGTRRDLLVWPEDVSLSSPSSSSLEVSFFLPSGSYATELVRELTGARSP